MVSCVLIAFIEFIFSLRSCGYIFFRYFIGGEYAAFSSRFNSHIGYGEPVGHGKFFAYWAVEFHRLVKSSVNAYKPDYVKNNIFSAYPFVEFSF